ncbi:MAG: XdhC family protein [Gemmatimonadaceae bacterium]|nr:XdhC family protein [Gemmatimonadaceae bacterium]
MSSHTAIIDELTRAALRRDSTVLATVVRVTGSSYGGVGSRMLVRVDGSTVGLVSGGCLESDLAEHAKRVSSTGRAEVVSYDTRNDEDAPWGLGLGCNGLIEVLLEPLNSVDAEKMAHLLEVAVTRAEPAVIATVIRVSESTAAGVEVGSHALLLDENKPISTGSWGEILIEVLSKRDDALSAGRKGFITAIGGAEISFEVVQPGVRLVVCGSGPDARPIAAFGAELGWDVTVVDHRPLTQSHTARFPRAKVAYCEDALCLVRTVSITPRTAAVVVSHHFERDRNYLESLLASDASYIGMLGPRARTERMLGDLAARGVKRGDGDARLYAPVGMDIGGDGPDAIALSIIAEVSAIMSKRTAMHLRDKRGPLHAVAATAASTP